MSSLLIGICSPLQAVLVLQAPPDEAQPGRFSFCPRSPSWRRRREFSVDAVKATYLFRFSSYVEWPESRAKVISSSASSATKTWRCTWSGCSTAWSVDGRPAKVRRVRRQGSRRCAHSLRRRDRVPRRRARCASWRSASPCSSSPTDRDGLDGGGVINFIEVDRNLRFEISLDAADRSGLEDRFGTAVGGGPRGRKEREVKKPGACG